MKTCVTGGSGFIGSYVCEALAAQGHELTVFDLIEPPPGTPHDHFVKGDVRNLDACRAGFEGCERLIHLAAAHHDFGIEHACYFSVNEAACQTICDAMDELGIRELVFYSTVALYGDGQPPLEETTTPTPNSPYGASKWKGEQVFERWTQKGEGRRCLVIRPTVTFGPRNFANMYSLIHQVYNGHFVFIGKAQNIKSLSYVENIVDATMFLLERKDLPAFDVYNYVEKPDLNSRQIAETIFEVLEKKPPRWSLPMWAARLAVLPLDIYIALTGKNIALSGARVKKLFQTQTLYEADKILAAGYQPKVPLKDGIRRMAEWYVAEGRDLSAEWHQPPTETMPFDGKAQAPVRGGDTT